ncbi:MAG: hypothetical protein K2G16_07405 [Lachnospiraceae bacterium]|nr:hypothetical protein [Lachnospiraceae bacterium]
MVSFTFFPITIGKNGNVTCRLAHAGYDKPYKTILVKRFGKGEAEEIDIL